MKPKLILCDIDGTMVTDEKVLTDYTRDTINRLHSEGIWFGIASGRPLDEIKYKNYNFDFEPEIIIGNNGADLKDGIHQKCYYDLKLKREWMKEITEIITPFYNRGVCNYFVNQNGYVYLKKMDIKMEQSLKRTAKQFIIVKDDSEMYEEENAKVLCRFFSVEEADKAMKEFSKIKSDNYKAFKTQPAMVEFQHAQVSKAYSLNKFCALNGISLEEVVACGDLTNDKEMLEVAGISICMANGSDDVKAISKVITKEDNNHDGLAICLNELKEKDWQI